MKYSTILGILLLLLFLISSCGKSPQEEITGDWEVEGEGILISFKADGSGFDNNRNRVFNWELIDEKDLVLRMKFNEQDIDKSIISFINQNEIELIEQDYPDNKIILKRIRKEQ